MSYDPSIDHCRRGNMNMWATVEYACTLVDSGGPLAHKYAARFLHNNCVPFDVAHRVLLHPAQRRIRK